MPFNDEKLTYDNKLHMYLLNKEYVMNTFLEFEDSDIEWKQKQLDISTNVYRYIYSFKNNQEDIDHMEYDLANNENYRDILSKVLLFQYQYATTTSGDTLQLQTGVNLGSDKVVDTNILRGEFMISTKGYMMLYNNNMLENTYRTNFDYSLYREGY